MARPYKRRTPSYPPETFTQMDELLPTMTASGKPKTYDMNQDIFATKGRGVPVNGYVLIAGLGVIDEATWQSRLKTKCQHGFGGWKCLQCNAKAV